MPTRRTRRQSVPKMTSFINGVCVARWKMPRKPCSLLHSLLRRLLLLLLLLSLCWCRRPKWRRNKCRIERAAKRRQVWWSPMIHPHKSKLVITIITQDRQRHRHRYRAAARRIAMCRRETNNRRRLRLLSKFETKKQSTTTLLSGSSETVNGWSPRRRSSEQRRSSAEAASANNLATAKTPPTTTTKTHRALSISRASRASTRPPTWSPTRTTRPTEQQRQTKRAM